MSTINERNRLGLKAARRGYAVLTAMMMLSFLLMMGMAVFGLASSSITLSSRRREAAQALQLAMGGLDEAVMRLRDDEHWQGFSNRSLGSGTLTVTVTTPVAYPGRRVVVSTAAVAGSNRTTVRSVRAMFDSEPTPPLFSGGYALVGKTDFILNGNVEVDSSPTVNRGNIHSNEDVTLHGSAVDVHGRVTATGTVTSSGAPNVTRGTSSGVAPVYFPEVDATFLARALTNGITATSVTEKDGGLVKGQILGNLVVGESSSGPSGCEITGVVWVTGNVTIDGPVTGTGTIVCEGKMTLNCDMSYSTSDVTKQLYICLKNDTSHPVVDLGGKDSFRGMVYAPNGLVKLHGTPDLQGGVLAHSVTFSGDPVITAPSSFGDNPPPVPNFMQMRGWEEI